MGSRGKLAAASLLVVALLLTTAWLAEWPPFAPPDPAALPALQADAAAGPTPADTSAGAAAQPGLAHAEEALPGDAAAGDGPGAKGLAPVAPAEPDAPRKPGVVAPVDPPIVMVDPGEREVREPLPRTSMPSAIDVQKAVDRAVAWLRKKQARDGSWGAVRGRSTYRPLEFFHDGDTAHDAGPTALVLYALRAANQPLRDPVLRKGFDWLWDRHKSPAMSMEAAAMLLAVTSTADRSDQARARKPKLSGRYRMWASRLADHLVGLRTAQGWRYNVKGSVESLQAGGPEDLVSTHLAALALFAAHELGIKTKDAVWLDILRFTVAQQEPADVSAPDAPGPRGFAYVLGHPISDEGKATGGTTACGIANLFLGVSAITDGGSRPLRFGQEDPALDKTMAAGHTAALAWLERWWDPRRNPGKREGAKVNHHHWLWALETAMDLDPRRPAQIGKYAWYGEVARGLLDRQHADGHWQEGGTWEPSDVLDTAFAILFLTRATRQIPTPR